MSRRVSLVSGGGAGEAPAAAAAAGLGDLVRTTTAAFSNSPILILVEV